MMDIKIFNLFLLVMIIILVIICLYKKYKDYKLRKKILHILNIIDMFLIKYADEHITDGVKIYPNKLNNIKDKLISEGIDFYKDFCICKNIVIVYKHIPITQSNKITKYLLSIIDTNYKIYYSKNSIIDEDEVIKTINENDVRYLKNYDIKINYYFFMSLCLIFNLILICLDIIIIFYIDYLDVINIFNLFNLISINIILFYISFKYRITLNTKLYKFIMNNF